MVNNYRVAPASSVPATLIQSPIRTAASADSSRARRNHRRCLAVVAIASTLVVAVLIGATVIIWLTLGSVIFGGSANTSESKFMCLARYTDDVTVGNNSRCSAFLDSTIPAQMQNLNQSNALPLETIPNSFSFMHSSNSTPSYVLSRTITAFIGSPADTSNNPFASVLTTKLSADSKSNFPPCLNANQIQCRSDGKCIVANKRCDKIKDCLDGSDEFNCSCVDVFRSTAPRKICDGYVDCPNGEDERGCAYQCQNRSGHQQSFRCLISSDCISINQVCDGHNDCPDGQDESECWMLSPNLDAITAPNYRTYYDFGYVFKRRNGVWYPVSLTADMASLSRYMCEQAGFRTVLYADLRTLTDSRVSGCFTVTGTHSAPIADSAYQFQAFCPNRKSLYLACDDFVCNHLPYCRPARKRIVGGTESGAYCNPWTIALYRDGEMVCHAVVVNNLWLMTAAHCFRTSELKRHWVARLGMYRQQSWSPNAIIRNIVAVIRHPNFTDATVETDDIALIRLDRPFTFSAALLPPCMPRIDGANADNPKDGETCTVFGWGYMMEDGLQFSDELRQVDLDIISIEKCNSTPGFFRTYITDSHLCLGHGSERKDACQGDSGGPLLCTRPSDRSRYLAGLTSTGDGCGRANTPGIWTRISKYIDWVHSTLSSSVSDLSLLSSAVGADKTCTGFQCATGKCVYSFYRCDGGWDCEVDGSDELYCSHDSVAEEQITTRPSVAHEAAPGVSGAHCGDEENDGYLCSDGVTCLPYYQRCDYVMDCPGGEDERNCFYCLDSDIPCDDSRRCLPFSISLTSISNDTFGRWLRDRFDCKWAK